MVLSNKKAAPAGAAVGCFGAVLRELKRKTRRDFSGGRDTASV
jgi:hypothetical protein